jgi:hydrogenase maturation protease
MGDDGLGPVAVEVLRREGLGERAELIDAGLAFSEVLCDLEPARALIIIDALRGQGDPGSIYRLTLDDLDPASGAMTSAVSLHEVNVLPALRMEALAGREFRDVTIFGIEPARVGWGEELTEPVADAIKRLVKIISNYLDDRAEQEKAATTASPCGSAHK